MITVEKQVTVLGTRFLARVEYGNTVAQSYSDSLHRCPYKAIAELLTALVSLYQRT